jgi:hypothetical protein
MARDSGLTKEIEKEWAKRRTEGGVLEPRAKRRQRSKGGVAFQRGPVQRSWLMV